MEHCKRSTLIVDTQSGAANTEQGGGPKQETNGANQTADGPPCGICRPRISNAYEKDKKANNQRDHRHRHIALYGRNAGTARTLFRQPGGHITPLNVGSRASLNPSPIILNPKTVSMIAIPGAKERIGLVMRYL